MKKISNEIREKLKTKNYDFWFDYDDSFINDTIGDVAEWLINKKNIFLEINSIYNIFDNKWYYKFISVNLITQEKKSNFFAYETPEEASLVGIEYIIDNVI